MLNEPLKNLEQNQHYRIETFDKVKYNSCECCCQEVGIDYLEYYNDYWLCPSCLKKVRGEDEN